MGLDLHYSYRGCKVYLRALSPQFIKKMASKLNIMSSNML